MDKKLNPREYKIDNDPSGKDEYWGIEWVVSHKKTNFIRVHAVMQVILVKELLTEAGYKWVDYTKNDWARWGR